jgi:transcriptional antiterminator NusG
MNGYHTVRCLFCTVGKEKIVVDTVHKNDWGHAIFPKRVGFVRTKGQWIEVSKPLLPGYVFVYSDEEQPRYDELASVNHVVRVLRYEKGCDGLAGRDLEFADWVWRNDGSIGAMRALQIGDWIEITDSVFKQLHGTIVRMDRRKRTFLVSLGDEGAIRKIWLTYEVIEKRKANPESLR